jgi:DNA-binding transcriptional LysR family regulator
MDRELLPHLPAVLAVARTRSFAKAAAELSVGASAISHAVRAAELRLGSPLFTRTTRSVALTEAGEAFIGTARRVFDELDTAIDRVRVQQGNITGLLRINAPHIALDLGLTPILADMTRRHPGITVEVVADNALSDVVAEGFDAGIRLGEMVAQDMVAVRMTAPLRAIMVASPRYIEAHGRPKTLAELAGHNCIGFRLTGSGAIYDWDLRDGERDVRVPVKGTTRVSEPSHARQLALAHIGIAYIFEPLVSADIASGRLMEIMPEASIVESGLFLYFPRRASDASKLRAFLDVVHTQRSAADKVFAKTSEP